jgi:hypothetical protein
MACGRVESGTDTGGIVTTMAGVPVALRQRWVMRRKAELLCAIQAGKITVEAACERFALSSEELAAWSVAYNRQGMNGLRASVLAARVAQGKLEKR